MRGFRFWFGQFGVFGLVPRNTEAGAGVPIVSGLCPRPPLLVFPLVGMAYGSAYVFADTIVGNGAKRCRVERMFGLLIMINRQRGTTGAPANNGALRDYHGGDTQSVGPLIGLSFRDQLQRLQLA
jgi:hypothetical protein